MTEEISKDARGYFIPMVDIQQAVRNGKGITPEDAPFSLTAEATASIRWKIACPCGQCQYYAIEIFEDGRWISHHHHKTGSIGEGTWKD